MFARDGGGIIFSAVAGAGEDGGEGRHDGAPCQCMSTHANRIMLC